MGWLLDAAVDGTFPDVRLRPGDLGIYLLICKPDPSTLPCSRCHRDAVLVCGVYYLSPSSSPMLVAGDHPLPAAIRSFVFRLVSVTPLLSPSLPSVLDVFVTR